MTGKLLLNYLANRTDCVARPGHCAAFQIESADCGLSWSAPPVSLAPALGAYNDGVRPGPGRGIQLTAGAKAGRILMSGSFDQRDPGSDPAIDLVWYSDDHGKTFNLSAARLPLGDESTLAELANGSVVINMRNGKPSGCSCRLVAISHDAGETFSEPYHIPDLIEPGGCQGSLLRDSLTGPDLFFSNPSSTHGRVNMTVKRSSDGGATWPSAVVVYPGASAYSCLAALPATPAVGDGGARLSTAGRDESRDASSGDFASSTRVGLVFEHGDGGSAYGSISFAALDESAWAA